MADTPAVKTRKVSRDKLALFLPNLELIKAFENLVEDVSTTLPEATAETVSATQEANDLAVMAQSLAATALQLANAAVQSAAAATDGPPPLPVVIPEPDDTTAQIAALREEVNNLRTLINDRFTGPTP